MINCRKARSVFGFFSVYVSSMEELIGSSNHPVGYKSVYTTYS